LAADTAIRGKIIGRLTEAAVQTSHHYSPVHLFRFYRDRFGCRPGDLPVTESFASREITLPLYSTMKMTDVDYVTEVMHDALRDAAGQPSRMGQSS